MIRGGPGNLVLWAVGVLVLAIVMYLAFAVFGVHTLFYNEEVNEESPSESAGSSAPDRPAEAAGPVAVSSGKFHGVAHEGAGDAIVYRQEDGSYVLRLENLDIFNGPDLYVYAVAAPDATDDATVLEAGFLNAGRLKGNQGNQTYELPADFDPAAYRSISVWCQRFSVNFATAPLQQS
jgi:hypothetical protein